MPPKELYGSQMAIRAINPDGTYGEPIEFIGPFLIEEEPAEIETSNEMPLKFLRNEALTFSTTFSINFHPKISHKTFKKWLMSKGIDRNTAEWFCIAVKSFKGKQSYRSLYFNGLFTSTAEDLITVLIITLFPIHK